MKHVLSVAVAIALLSGCWKDPDAPDTWLAQINKSRFKREEALVNLYRIHETAKALAEEKGKTGEKYKKALEKFRKKVNPALMKAFDKKINNKYVVPQKILEHLIMFKADQAGPLYTRIIDEYVNRDTEKYGDEDTQEGLVAKALSGLADLATRGKCPENALDTIEHLVKRICVRHDAAKALEETLDPNSFIRNAVVKAMPKIVRAFPQRRAIMGRILSTILDYGFRKGEVQDPMVNIFAGRALGDVGDISPSTIEALTKCLYRKGRGRAFHPYCTVAMAKLPDGPNGLHPAVEPLLLLFKGDPWVRKIAKLKKAKKTKEADELAKRLDAGGAMPQCPEFIPTKYRYVCEIYWESRTERWEAKEPGVVQVNSIITLREIGELGPNAEVARDMYKLYGAKALEKKWFSQIQDKKDRWLPGVQMQRMQIKGYGRDMNIRMEYLFAAGRLGAAAVLPEVKRDFIRGLDWSQDPGSMVKAAEAIARSPYDETMVRTLITKIKTVQSWIGHAFKYRMFKHASWAKAKRQCPEAEDAINKLWNECIDSGKIDEVCFLKFRDKYWLPELKKLVGYYEANDVKDYLNPVCAKNMPQRKEPACKTKLTEEDKKHGVPKCGEWGPCNAENFYTCLDGDQQLRLQYAEEASRVATPKEATLLSSIKPQDLLRPTTRSEKDLPQKDKSIYFDPTDHALAKNPYAILPKKLQAARRRRAIETVKRRLCLMRRRVDVLNECKYDVGCYIDVLKGTKIVHLRDCTKPDQPEIKTSRPDWRQREKAAYMLANIARKDRREDAVRALCAAYADASVSVRRAILLALDRLADKRDADKADRGQLLIKVAEDETRRRVKGVWQINRDARSCVGRMRRRKPGN